MNARETAHYNAWLGSFPGRIWERGLDGLWASRAATKADWDRRREFAQERAEQLRERGAEVGS